MDELLYGVLRTVAYHTLNGRADDDDRRHRISSRRRRGPGHLGWGVAWRNGCERSVSGCPPARSEGLGPGPKK